jgi:hypothetical protein
MAFSSGGASGGGGGGGGGPLGLGPFFSASSSFASRGPEPESRSELDAAGSEAAAGAGAGAVNEGVAGLLRRMDWTNVQAPVQQALLLLSEAFEGRAMAAAAAAGAAGGGGGGRGDGGGLELRVSWLARAVEDLQRRVRPCGRV